jgi:CHAT domain-containing protein
VANPKFGPNGSGVGPPAGRLTRQASEIAGRDGTLAPLPHTQIEANAISGSYPGAVVKAQNEAQESTIKSVAGSFRVIHFATHALVNNAAPMLSGVVLAHPPQDSPEDGVLTVRELFSMDLAADMIVFSACNTARGSQQRGEGMIGLTWAAFVAGAPAQVVSQWAVDDAATARLMGRFYQRLRAGKAKSDALRDASLTLMRESKYKHPYYWAPFLVMGDWR